MVYSLRELMTDLSEIKDSQIKMFNQEKENKQNTKSLLVFLFLARD